MQIWRMFAVLPIAVFRPLGMTTLLLASSLPSQTLLPSQLVSPTALTPREAAYYAKLTDPDTARNFIITRSYVRLCQAVVDKTLPAGQLPDKPVGFSVRYLLPGEVQMINSAIASNIVAQIKN